MFTLFFRFVLLFSGFVFSAAVFSHPAALPHIHTAQQLSTLHILLSGLSVFCIVSLIVISVLHKSR